MDRGSCRGAIEGTKSFSIDPPAVERCRDCDNKQLKSSIDKLGIERCQGVIEIAIKIVFQERKNTDMNAIKHATQPKIQTSF